jgi:hypothetical protein
VRGVCLTSKQATKRRTISDFVCRFCEKTKSSSILEGVRNETRRLQRHDENS